MNKYQEILNKQIEYAEFTENSVVCLDIEVAKGLLTKSPTLEEVKREWEALGYKYKYHNDSDHLSLYKPTKEYIYQIDIFIKEKTYYCNNFGLNFQEHQLLTKTMKALGWL